MRLSNGFEETAVVDTASAFPIVADPFCKRYNIPVDRSSIREYTSLATSGGGMTVGTAIVDFDLCNEHFSLECGVVPRSDWPLILPSPFFESHLFDVLYSRKEVKGRKGSVPMVLAKTAENASSCLLALALSKSVDSNLFVRVPFSDEQRKWDAMFPLPSRDSLLRRVQIAQGGVDKSRVVDLLMTVPRLGREYHPNAPPPLPIAPIELPWVPDAEPPYVRQWPESHAARSEKEKQLRDLRDHGVLETATSFGNIPVFLKPKPDGSGARLLSDDRAVNELLRPVRCDSPTLAELHAWLGDAEYVSSLDAASFFHQFVLGPKSRSFFALHGGSLGRLQYTRLPQGASCSPAIATAYLLQVLRNVQDISRAFADNILVKSTSGGADAHLRALERVLSSLDKGGVTLNLRSSHWAGQRDIPALGILWSKGSTRLMPSRVGDLLAQPRPKRLPAVRSLVAALSQLIPYVPNVQRLAGPFQALIGPGKAFAWSDQLETAWLAIRSAIAASVTNHYPTPEDHLVVASDASDQGWGGVLLIDRGGRRTPVAWASRTWKGQEAKWSVVEREVKALLACCERFRMWTGFHPRVTYETDSFAASRVLAHQGDDELTQYAIKLSRLGVKEENIKHVPGSYNSLADYASRVPAPANDLPPGGPAEAADGGPALAVGDIDPLLPAVRYMQPITRADQLADPRLASIIALLERLDRDPKGMIEVDGLIDSQAASTLRRYVLDDGLLHWIEYEPRKSVGIQLNRPVQRLIEVPRQRERDVIDFVHESKVHPRGSAFVQALRDMCHFPEMRHKALDFQQTCHLCQLHPPRAAPAGLGQRTWANVGEHVYLDVGEVREAGGVAGLILVMTDQESRFVEARPLTNHTAQALVEAFHWGWVVPYGSPVTVTTDNAPEFKSHKWGEYLSLIGTEHKPSSVYNPQGDVAETAVKKIKDHVSMLRASQAFSPGLPLQLNMVLMNACRALNAEWSNAALGRPEEIFLGRPRRGFDDHLLTPRPRQVQASAVRRAPRTEPFFDSKARYPVFPVGTLVSLLEQRAQKRGSRLLKASGPYRVTSLSRGTRYWLEDMAGDPLPEAAHVRWLQPYHLRDGRLDSLPILGGPARA